VLKKKPHMTWSGGGGKNQRWGAGPGVKGQKKKNHPERGTTQEPEFKTVRAKRNTFIHGRKTQGKGHDGVRQRTIPTPVSQKESEGVLPLSPPTRGLTKKKKLEQIQKPHPFGKAEETGRTNRPKVRRGSNWERKVREDNEGCGVK